jgi:hypothetical protein
MASISISVLNGLWSTLFFIQGHYIFRWNPKFYELINKNFIVSYCGISWSSHRSVEFCLELDELFLFLGGHGKFSYGKHYSISMYGINTPSQIVL